MTTLSTATVADGAPLSLSAILSGVAQTVDVDAATRRIVASRDGSQSIVRSDRRFSDADTVAPTVVRRAERRLTVKRAANMIAHRTGESAAAIVAEYGNPMANAPRDLVDRLAKVHTARVER